MIPQLNIPIDREPTEAEEAAADAIIAEAKAKLRKLRTIVKSEPRTECGIRVYSWSTINKVPIYRQQ